MIGEYMDFKQIEAFVNVVRYKSFSRAADATFFTQPTISTHIGILEKELGTKLLDRKGRTVEMTQQGRQFYKYAVEMVNTRALAIAALDKESDKVEGVLEMQTSSIPGITFLPKKMTKFRKQHPRAQFYVTQSDSATVVENVIERRGELGFIGEKGNNPNIEYNKIFSDRSVLVVSNDMFPDVTEVEVDDIVGLPFIWRESGSATRKTFEDAMVKRGFDRASFEIVAMFNDLDSVISSVEAGLGVSILSEQTVANLSSRSIHNVAIKDFNVNRDFYMINMKSVALSPVAEAFKQFVLDEKMIQEI